MPEARFTPGAIVGGRYRVVSLLALGGMGEVYRAEDMKLGQQVALKFLPVINADQLQLLYGEVRIGRQVSHPNVCRLYDIAEADGHHFITMEYVDGEDLASLLRRIGQLPAAKALDIARGLCSGLAAAHDRDVIHGDLKPQNVMIDGRGRARITDFGLASISGERGPGALAGTPAYMAPEQLAGKQASFKSDIYALGLILHEMLTGERIFEGSLFDIVEQHRSGKRPALRGIDPEVGRLVLRCLEEDPAARPATAYDLSTALFGRDPLATAMAAGETPSPAMVAAAGKSGVLHPATAWTLLGLVIAGSLLTAFLADKTYRRVSPQKPPEAFSDRAKEIIARVGYPQPAADSASWFLGDGSAITFWYRQSPTTLVAINRTGALARFDPPESLAGMVAVNLDSKGRLLELRAVPPRVDVAKAPWPEPNWSTLFTEAGFDVSRFKPVEPAWTPPFGNDARAAWDGPMHVEAAAYHGKPVWFQVLESGTLPDELKRATPIAGSRQVYRIIITLVILIGMVAGIMFARRNARLGRGHRPGATKIAIVVFVMRMLYWLVVADHVPQLSTEYDRFVTGTGRALFYAAFVWVLYMALEPYVRRRWPEMLISWSRLLAGRFNDPLVGRDILIGCITGIVATILLQMAFLVSAWPGFTGPMDDVLEGWQGGRHVAALFFYYQSYGLLVAFLSVFLLVLFRVILRRQWLAVAAWMTLSAAPGVLWVDNPYAAVLLGLAQAALTVTIIIRVGLLAIVSAIGVRYILLHIPITLDFSSWYAGFSVFALLLIAAIALYGFHVSLGGKPMFGRMLEE